MKNEIIQTQAGAMTVLYPEAGKILTDAGETFFSESVYLGRNDAPDNYHEVVAEYVDRESADRESSFL